MERLPELLIWFVPFIFSLSFHEAAHAWMANRLGDPTARLLGRLTLNPRSHIDWIGTVAFPILSYFTRAPLIGWARPVPVNERNLRRPLQDGLWVAAAGPGSNLLLAFGFTALLFLLLRIGGESGAGRFSVREPLLLMVHAGIQINLILAFFNLIPLPPLDGGRVLAGLFPSLAPLLRSIERYGFVLLLLLFATGIVNRIIFIPMHLMYTFLLGMAV